MINFIKENWIVILSLIYIISPIDFIPEILVGPLGLFDDLGVVIFLILLAAYREYRKRQKLTPIKTDSKVLN